jgi:hypothetical protein
MGNIVERVKEKLKSRNFYEEAEEVLGEEFIEKEIKEVVGILLKGKLRKEIEEIVFNEFNEVYSEEIKNIIKVLLEDLRKNLDKILVRTREGRWVDLGGGKVFVILDFQDQEIAIRTEYFRVLFGDCKEVIRKLDLILEGKEVGKRRTRVWWSLPKRVKYQGQSFVVSVYKIKFKKLEEIGEEFLDEVEKIGYEIEEKFRENNSSF